MAGRAQMIEVSLDMRHVSWATCHGPLVKRGLLVKGDCCRQMSLCVCLLLVIVLGNLCRVPSCFGCACHVSCFVVSGVLLGLLHALEDKMACTAHSKDLPDGSPLLHHSFDMFTCVLQQS